MTKEGLKEGMYVRTNEGHIAKFIEKAEVYSYRGSVMAEENRYFVGYKYYFDDNVDGLINTILLECEIEEIEMSPSFDIIDLIKPGDYVNGRKVIIAGYNIFDDLCVTVESNGNPEEDYIYPKDIKTILTKEQYEMNRYEVKNEDI